MDPILYPLHQFDISIDQIDPDALSVIYRLQEGGHIAYLVGGSVRDLLFGCRPKDFDISTSARPEEIRRMFRNSMLIGRRFRLAHIRFGKKILEVSTFRAGDPETDALIIQDNEWGDPEEDVLRRDFTINGLYLDPYEEAIIDYVGGVADVERRRLMTIGVPEVRFRQDPVRMIRLLKFRARFQLAVEPSTEKALWSCCSEIQKSAPARVLEELLRMLESGSSAPFFRYMSDYGLLEQILPELSVAFSGEEGSPMFQILRAIDLFHSRARHRFSRPTLLSAMIWPLFEVLIRVHQEQEEKALNLSQITDLAEHMVGHILSGFSHFPKKLRQQMIFCLANQYRLTPLADRKGLSKWRAPNSDRQESIGLLKLRATLDPSLMDTYEHWRKNLFSSGKSA